MLTSTRSLSRLTAFAVLTGLAAVACGKAQPGGTGRTSTTVIEATDAQQRLKAIVDATALAIGIGLERAPANQFSMTVCEGTDVPKDSVRFPYGVAFALPPDSDGRFPLDAARAYWSANGFAIGDSGLTRSSVPPRDPTLHGAKDGYGLLLHVVPWTGRAYLDGNTPCVPGA